MQRKPTNRYWRAYGALYGSQGEQFELGATTPRGNERSSNHGQKKGLSVGIPSEVEEQIMASTWLTKKNIIFYHIPNGGYRDYREAIKFKRMGVKPGVPDICIPIAKKGYHGLYIELKRVKGGNVSDSQTYWLNELKKQGYDVFVAKGAAELIQYVQNYLGD